MSPGSTNGDAFAAEAGVYDRLRQGLTQRDLNFWVNRCRAVGTDVLEIACGTGRVLLPCAEVVEEAVGVDLSPAMLAECRRGQEQRGLSNVRLHEGDMLHFDLRRQFPFVFLAGQSLTFLHEDDHLVAALINARRHLAPGGKLAAAIPVPRPEDLVRNQDQLRLLADFEDSGRRTVVWGYTRFDPVTQRVHRRRILEHLKDDGVVLSRQHAVQEFTYRHPREMFRLLRASGLRITEMYGGYAGEPFDSSSETLVWIVEAT